MSNFSSHNLPHAWFLTHNTTNVANDRGSKGNKKKHAPSTVQFYDAKPAEGVF